MELYVVMGFLLGIAFMATMALFWKRTNGN